MIISPLGLATSGQASGQLGLADFEPSWQAKPEMAQ